MTTNTRRNLVDELNDAISTVKAARLHAESLQFVADKIKDEIMKKAIAEGIKQGQIFVILGQAYQWKSITRDGIHNEHILEQVKLHVINQTTPTGD